jgi:hypothetical protein
MEDIIKLKEVKYEVELAVLDLYVLLSRLIFVSRIVLRIIRLQE